jgi:hypothetical protein
MYYPQVVHPPTTLQRFLRELCVSATAMVRRSSHRFFERQEENPPLREAIDFYLNAHGWSNRLIVGDSLLVMNSLLEKEGTE